MRWLYITVITLFLSLFPAYTMAATISIGSDTVIEEGEEVLDNLYVVGGASRIFSGGEGDVMSLHGDGVISGEIKGDLLVVGLSTIVNGIIRGDVRVLGGSVQINARVEGDVVILAGDAEIQDGAQIDGDVITISEHAKLNGHILGSITSLANTFELLGVSEGMIKSTNNRMIVRHGAIVKGQVAHSSPNEATIENGAQIESEIAYNQIRGFRDQAIVERTIVTFFSFWRVLQFVTSLIIIFFLVHVFKVFSKSVSDYVLDHFFKAFAIGLASAVVIPVIAFILMVSIFALPIGIILMSLYTVGILISTSMASIYLGVYFKRITGKGSQRVIGFGSAAIALLVLTILQFVPYVGDIVRIFVGVIAFGGIIRTIYQSIRFHGKNLKI